MAGRRVAATCSLRGPTPAHRWTPSIPGLTNVAASAAAPTTTSHGAAVSPVAGACEPRLQHTAARPEPRRPRSDSTGSLEALPNASPRRPLRAPGPVWSPARSRAKAYSSELQRLEQGKPRALCRPNAYVSAAALQHHGERRRLQTLLGGSAVVVARRPVRGTAPPSCTPHRFPPA